MNNDHLVSMANQIGSFFDSYPDQEEAASEIASHLRRFWAPRMRLQLLAHVEHADGAGLQAPVLAAIRRHSVTLMPRARQAEALAQ